MLCCDNAVLMIWLGSDTKNTQLGLGKDHVLASYIWLCHHKHSWRCPEVSLKVSRLQCCRPSSKPSSGFQTYKRLNAVANWSLWHGILLVWPHSLLKRGHTISGSISVNWINSTISGIEMVPSALKLNISCEQLHTKNYDYLILMTFSKSLQNPPSISISFISLSLIFAHSLNKPKV